MQHNVKYIVLFNLLGILLFLLFFINIVSGTVAIPLKEVLNSLFGGTISKTTWEYIIINYRLPKAITAILVGIGLSVSGLLMQTLFRNPLAGPDVLGLNSGAGLGAGFVIMGADFAPRFLEPLLRSPFGMTIASCSGSFLVLLAILLAAQKMKNTMTILIVGLMFGSFTNAFIGILTFFSTAEQLQQFYFWTLGNLSNVSWASITIMSIGSGIGLLLSFVCIKSLNALLLGENYAQSLGIDLRRTRLILILATAIFTGSITIFAGPIAFIGLTVPHIAKLLFRTSNHSVLFCATILLGPVIMLFCDTITQIPGKGYILPINVVTSIVGAPIVIWLLLSQHKKMV